MITSPPESSRARLLKFRRINHVITLGNQDREVVFVRNDPTQVASTICVTIDVLFYVSRVFPANGRPEQFA